MGKDGERDKGERKKEGREEKGLKMVEWEKERKYIESKEKY